MLFVVSCGGESGENSIEEPITEYTEPIQEVVEPEPIPEFERPSAKLPPDNHVCYETDRDELVDFIEDIQSYDISEEPISRWTQAPVVKIARGADDRQKLLVEKAVELVNISLPDSYNITIDNNPVSPGSDKYDVPDGEIWVEFVGEFCTSSVTPYYLGVCRTIHILVKNSGFKCELRPNQVDFCPKNSFLGLN